MSVSPDDHLVAAEDAGDRVVDALLRVQHELPLDRERRIRRVMRSVRGGRTLVVRWAGGLVAAAAIAMALVVGSSPVNAADQARQLASRSGAGGDRRAMFVVSPPTVHQDRPPISGTIDVRDSSHMVLTLRTPDGREEIFGRDGDRCWSLVDGQVREMPSGRPWPVWIQSPRGGLLVDLPEMIESGLLTGWNWTREPGKSGEPGTSRLVATRKPGPPAEPVRIEVVTNGTIKRAEIGWAAAERRAGGEPNPMPRQGASDRPGRGDRPPPRMDDSEGDRRPPPPRMDGSEGDRPPPPRADRADGNRPPPPEANHVMHAGVPGSLVLIPEPAISFPAGWFSPERLVPKAATP
jgi:hypothetical protein